MTVKQQIAATKLVENGGNIGKAMIAAGYSPATAKTPKKLTATKAWGELMDKMFNDEEIRRQHSFLINQFTDLGVKAKAIDMYYKVSGKYTENPANEQTQASLDEIRQSLKDMVGAR